MSANIPSFYVSQFSTNVQLMLQQKGSRLKGSVMSGSHVGKQASPVDQIFSVEAAQVAGRFNPMGRVDAVEDRRWVFPVDYDLPQMIDSFDKLRLLIDPSSQYVQNAMYAMGRAQDKQILNAFFAAASNGASGSGSISFLTNLTTNATPGQVVSVLQGSTAASGLTVAKLKEAKRQLMANEVDLDMDPLTCVITSKQHDNLLSEAQIIDTDFNDKPVLVEGRIARFLGINFIHSELLSTGTDDNSGTSTAVPLYAKSGMYLGNWEDIKTDISQRKDLQGIPYQAYAYGTFGATRLDEKRVIKIWCR